MGNWLGRVEIKIISIIDEEEEKKKKEKEKKETDFC
jgi:hypothetical protein